MSKKYVQLRKCLRSSSCCATETLGPSMDLSNGSLGDSQSLWRLFLCQTLPFYYCYWKFWTGHACLFYKWGKWSSSSQLAIMVEMSSEKKPEEESHHTWSELEWNLSYNFMEQYAITGSKVILCLNVLN